jgi:hypothetical protein
VSTGGGGEDARCEQCGAPLNNGERFCRRCGTSTDLDRASPPSPAAPGTPAGPPPPSQPPKQSDSPQPPPADAQPPPGSPQFGGYPSPPPGYQEAGYPAPPTGHQYAGYPTPPPAYPATQQYSVPATQPEQAPQKNSAWVIGGVAAATLAVVGIGVGIYAAASGSSSGKTQLLAAPVITVSKTTGTESPASSPPALSTHTQTHASAPVPTPPPPRAKISDVSEQRAVSSTIQRHFSLITQHRFTAAYALLAPSLQTGESSWVAAHQEDGIYNVDVAVDATVHSPTSATASIVKMTTLDGHGCKRWSGGWGLTKISGQWRISESNLSATPC